MFYCIDFQNFGFKMSSFNSGPLVLRAFLNPRAFTLTFELELRIPFKNPRIFNRNQLDFSLIFSCSSCTLNLLIPVERFKVLSHWNTTLQTFFELGGCFIDERDLFNCLSFNCGLIICEMMKTIKMHIPCIYL